VRHPLGHGTAPEADALARFRAALSATGLGHCRERLFETVEAVRAATAPEPQARLSLTAGFNRGWASVSAGLSDGQVPTARLARLPAAGASGVAAGASATPTMLPTGMPAC
jgi:hypothetical protein